MSVIIAQCACGASKMDNHTFLPAPGLKDAGYCPIDEGRSGKNAHRFTKVKKKKVKQTQQIKQEKKQQQDHESQSFLWRYWQPLPSLFTKNNTANDNKNGKVKLK